MTATRGEVDLRDQAAARRFLKDAKPQAVFLAAAKVGGILANDTMPVEFLQDNLLIATNVIGGAFEIGVEKLQFLGSSCIYPREAPQPMKEDALLTGRWSRPTSGTRSPKSPGSSCVTPTAASTARISSR